ncbi:MAG TPA: hypothetical protein PK771_01395 [Spirochaetota bacterium]|nr:hypothetical protein [Spirochaetota bacterium]
MVSVSDIKNVIAEIQKHYDKHINNKYVKNITMRLDLGQSVIQNMNLILSGNLVYIDSKGAIEDLYYGIKAVLDFISETEQKIIPNMNLYYTGPGSNNTQNMGPNDKILSQMAIKNYSMNLKLFFDMISKLFIMVNEFDKINFSKDPAYKRINNFPQIEALIEELKSKFAREDD